MSAHTARRFYKQVSVVADADGFVIHLDQRVLRTPAKQALVLPTRALADMVATEWQAQEEQIVPATMPLMQLVSTAVDRIVPHRAAVIVEALRYAETDLLCYRANHPTDLVALQSQRWQPLLDWATQSLGARLETTSGLTALSQAPESLLALQRHMDAMDLWRLTAAQSLTAACGSLVLALATVAGRISGETAWELALLDELFQNQQWGEDSEAVERRAALHRDILAAEQLVRLTQ